MYRCATPPAAAAQHGCCGVLCWMTSCRRCTLPVCRYISEDFGGLALHPVDLLDASTGVRWGGVGVGEGCRGVE